MDIPGQRWTVQDRYGNPLYLTVERWQHILESRLNWSRILTNCSTRSGWEIASQTR